MPTELYVFILISALLVFLYIKYYKWYKRKNSNSNIHSGVYFSEEEFKKSPHYAEYLRKKEEKEKRFEELLSRIEEEKSDPEKHSGKLNFAIKGLSFCNKEAKIMANGCKVGDELTLEPEPNNKHDKYAVKVIYENEYKIGYVDSSYSQKVSSYINKNYQIVCFISKYDDSHNSELPFLYMDMYFFNVYKD